MQTTTMPTNKPAIYHKLPLTIAVGSGDNIDLTCDVPGIKVKVIAGQLKLTLPAPMPTNVEHQYYYTIAAPKPDQAEVHYVAVFSGPDRESMAIWAQENGASRSPNFSMTSGKHGMFLSLVVLSEPRNAGPQINSQDPAPTAARTRSSTRYVTSEYQGGGDDR